MKTTTIPAPAAHSLGQRVGLGLAEHFELVEADQCVEVRSRWFDDPVAVIESFRPTLRLHVNGPATLDRGIDRVTGRLYVNVSAARVVLVVVRHALTLVDSTLERVRATPNLDTADYQDWQTQAKAALTEATALAEQRVEEERRNRYRRPDRPEYEEEHRRMLENSAILGNTSLYYEAFPGQKAPAEPEREPVQVQAPEPSPTARALVHAVRLRRLLAPEDRLTPAVREIVLDLTDRVLGEADQERVRLQRQAARQ